MRLGDRLKQPGSEGTASVPTEATPEVKRRDSFELKVQVHRILIERLDLSKLISVEREKLEGEFRQEVAKILRELRPGANGGEEGKIVDEILDEIFGLGPIEPLLNDPAVEEIMVNGAKQVFVARHGKIVLTDTIFKDNDHLLKIIERIVSRVGRRVDESSPMVDARLLDGSRVNAVIPPLALKGPSLTIRLFPKKRLDLSEEEARGGGFAVPSNFIGTHGGTFEGVRECPLESSRLRRDGLREDDSPQCPLALHPGRRTDCHHRRFRRTSASSRSM